MKKEMAQATGFTRGRAFLAIALCSLVLAGCISPMTSNLASERIKGLSDVMREQRILASDAELVVKLMKDPDPEVRKKAFDVFVKRQIQIERKREAFWVWIITREYVDSDGGFSFSCGLQELVSRISGETAEWVRAAMWKSLSDAYSRSREAQYRESMLEEEIIRSRYPESMKKEFINVVWRGKEVELLNRLASRLGDSFVTVLRLIDNPDIIESFMRETKKDNPDAYRHGRGYQDAAKRLAEIDKTRYAKYAVANCADFWDVEIAVDVLDDEDLLTVIVLKGLRDVTGTDNSEERYAKRVPKVLEQYLRKVHTQKFVFKVLEAIEMKPSTAHLFLDALKDEGLLAKALCNQAILDKAVYVMSEGGIRVLHKCVDRVRKDENLVEIVKANTRLSPYALKSVGNQDFLYQVLLKKVPLRYSKNEEEVKKIVMGKLDDAHKKAYQKALDEAGKDAWHRKFDPLMKKAEAGDVGAMREVADDAVKRNEMGVAASWYTKICEADTKDGYACVQAGDCYAASKNSIRDLKEARKYYALAVARGFENARTKLNLVSLRLEHPEMSGESLNQFAQRNGGRPDRQCYYEYSGGMGPGRYKIFQAVPARRGVLVLAAAFCDSAFYDGNSDYWLKRDLLFIETDEPYVDGDWLKEGVFLYVGRYTYTTSAGGSNSVHMFKEWKAATDLKTVIAREGSVIIGAFGVRFGVMPKDLSEEDVGKVGQPVPIPESDGGGFSFTYDYQGNHGIWDEFSFWTGGESLPTIYKVMASKSYATETKALSDAQEFLEFLKGQYGIPTAKNPMAKEGKVWLQMFDQPGGTVLLAVKVFEKGGKYHLTYSLSDFTKNEKED